MTSGGSAPTPKLTWPDNGLIAIDRRWTGMAGFSRSERAWQEFRLSLSRPCPAAELAETGAAGR